LEKNINLQKEEKIIEQDQKSFMEKEDCSWILRKLKTTIIKKRSLDTSITTYMDTW